LENPRTEFACIKKNSPLSASDNGLSEVERKGVEPSTFALRTRQPAVVSETGKEVITTPESVCTRVCTSDEKIPHEPADAASRSIVPDSDLAAVVEAWAALPAAVRAGIVVMVRAAAG
jgi:hypothetical protein